MPKVIDCITFHDEYDLFDLRYRMLEPYVDEFVVMESTTNFAGEPKDLHFPKIKWKYPKVSYHINWDDYTQDEVEEARKSPNTGHGHIRWIHEFLQKEQLKKYLTHLDPEDTVFIGDVDEIWDPAILSTQAEGLRKLKLRVYTYYLDMRSDEVFWGPIVGKWGYMRGLCLNHLRNGGQYDTENYWGWHFTNQGGLEAVKRKVTDQYNPEVFGNETWENLENRFGKRDYVGRNFALTVDDSEWPEWLKEHRDEYKHLLKGQA